MKKYCTSSYYINRFFFLYLNFHTQGSIAFITCLVVLFLQHDGTIILNIKMAYSANMSYKIVNNYTNLDMLLSYPVNIENSFHKKNIFTLYSHALQ